MVSGGRSAGPGLRSVLSSCLGAVRRESNPLGLPPLRRAAVLLVDGLAADALDARSGHARTLAAASGKRARIASGFPTTTAAAIPSLTTGEDPGTTGMVGYTVFEPASGRVVNQLRGFDDGSLPTGWQRSPTLFERAAGSGVAAVAIGQRHYAKSGFTAEVLRGAEYLPGSTPADRMGVLAEFLAAPGPGIAYVYAAELDVAGHANGWQSDEWLAALEQIDEAVRGALPNLPPDTGLLVTADHGMVDVQRNNHVVLSDRPKLTDTIGELAGEPRCLQVHLRPGVDAAVAAEVWRAELGPTAQVVTRHEAVADGWFGEVADEVRPRIGDLIVAARGRVAFYREDDSPGRAMIGQHGSWSRPERMVPLLRFGAAARVR